jgi:hypothetical protein
VVGCYKHRDHAKSRRNPRRVDEYSVALPVAHRAGSGGMPDVMRIVIGCLLSSITNRILPPDKN